MAQHLWLILGVLLTCFTQQINGVLRIPDTGAAGGGGDDKVTAAAPGLTNIFHKDNHNTTGLLPDVLAGKSQIINDVTNFRGVIEKTALELSDTLKIDNRKLADDIIIDAQDILAGNLHVSIIEALRIRQNIIHNTDGLMKEEQKSSDNHYHPGEARLVRINENERTMDVNEQRISDSSKAGLKVS